MKKKPRVPRPVKCPINTAKMNATCLTDAETDELMAIFEGALAKMATGEATDNDHAAIDAALHTAFAIEKSGIVTGFLPDLLHGQAASNKYVTGQPLGSKLVGNIDWALASHRFQLKQVSARELADIVKKLRAQAAQSKE
jgi:hypothetical protein